MVAAALCGSTATAERSVEITTQSKDNTLMGLDFSHCKSEKVIIICLNVTKITRGHWFSAKIDVI